MTVQSPMPAKGRKSPGPKYCFPTRETDRSRKDQVPIFISTLRLPHRYSMMKPMRLMPPKLTPMRTSSGPESATGRAPRPPLGADTNIERARTMQRAGRMIEVEYAKGPMSGQASFGSAQVPARTRAHPAPIQIWPGARAWLAALAVFCLSCSFEDARPPALDTGVLAYLGGEDVQRSAHGPGVAHYDVRNAQEPWAVQLLRVELARCELGLEVLEGPVGEGSAAGRSTVSELVGAAAETVIAAVNGDFFTPEGQPVGTEVVSGIVRRIRSRPVLAWRPGADPWVGIPDRTSGEGLRLGGDSTGANGPIATQAIGGFPLLLLNGSRVGDLEVSQRPSFAAERHPRTAVGFDEDESVLWVLVVDGRQPEHSMGMTLPELAGLLEALGVEEAINLDGGGSSAMVVGGTTVNHPSDAEGERPVVNALGIRRDPGFCSIQD